MSNDAGTGEDAEASADARTDVVAGVDLSADSYTVKQSLIRNKYAVYGPDGEVVLRAKQKIGKLKEEFPFTDADGDVVFRVKAGGILDIAGDYTLTDEASGEPIAVLEKQFTFLKHVWRIRDPDTDELLATVESGSVLLELLRNVSTLASFLPHSYVIEGPDGERFGEIQGQFSVRDRYDLTVRASGDAPKEALVAACVAVDALEGN